MARDTAEMIELASADIDNKTLVWHESLRGESLLPGDRLIILDHS